MADFAQRSNIGKITKSNLRLEAAGIQRAYQVMVSKSITVGGNPKIGSDKLTGGVAFLNNKTGVGTRVIHFETAANSASTTAKYLASQKEQFDSLSENLTP